MTAQHVRFSNSHQASSSRSLKISDRRTARTHPTWAYRSCTNQALECHSLITQDLFTNTRPLWRPPGARGLYGGSVIAQCLAAAHKSVPSDFLIHSMHCYFVLAGNPDVPIIYYVERIRSGRSFATRTVQARQKGNVIFTTTMSFMKEGSGGKKLVEHFRPMPFVPGPEDDSLASVLVGDRGPIMSRSIDIWNSTYGAHSCHGSNKLRLLSLSPLQAMSPMDQSNGAHL